MEGTKAQVQQYQKEARRHYPKPPVLRNVLTAFLVGGGICAAAQPFLLMFQSRGLPMQEAAAATTSIVMFFGALLTGLGVYDRLGRWAGMGANLPVSGFANSIAAPAIEYKREGMVLGVGARMFTVAGPVLVYGLTVSILSAALSMALRGF